MLSIKVRKTERQRDIPTNISNKSSHRRCSLKKVFLQISQNSLENTYARFSFLIKLPATLLKKETLVEMFSCEIFKNTFFYRTPPVAASVANTNKVNNKLKLIVAKFLTIFCRIPYIQIRCEAKA